MDAVYYEYLCDLIPQLIPSQSMCIYLRKHMANVEKWKIIEMILGSPISLTEKLDIFQRLSTFENTDIRQQKDEDDEDYWMLVHDSFRLYAKLTTEALNDLQPSDTSVFLLKSYCWDGSDQQLTDSVLFSSVQEAMSYLEEEYEGEDITHIWHFLEKWERKNGKLIEIRDYSIVNHQICHYGDSSQFILPYCGHSGNLNLPVPFKPGDFVLVDGQPFCGSAIAMITSIGDNHDCCCLQAVYLDYKGNLAHGAIKHATVFSAQGPNLFPLMSPLYRIEPFHGELPAEWKPLLVLRKYLKGDPLLIDDIYFTAMLRFQHTEDITEEAMQEVYLKCLARQN